MNGLLQILQTGVHLCEQILGSAAPVFRDRIEDGAPTCVQERLTAAHGLAESTPALGPEVIAGELETMLQGADVLLIEGQGVPEDRGRVLHGIPLRQSRPGGGHHKEQSGGDQGDQEGFKTLMGQGEPQC